MERLTNRIDTQCSMSPWDWCGLDSVCKRDCSGCPIPAKLRRLAEYENAIEDGRMVTLPCKPGDTVWVLRRFHDKKVPIAGTVTELRFTEFWHPLIIVEGVGRGRWGEKIFATIEEAKEKI